jgi:hypothetical protein
MGWEFEILEKLYKTLSDLVAQLLTGFVVELKIW